MSKRDRISLAASAAIGAYFLYLAIPALGAKFASDDPMNLGFYWIRGFWGSAWDDLRFWSTAYRPMGAMFYLPIYRFAGLNPAPYRIAILMLLAANVFLTFRVAGRISHSKPAAALAAFLACAHPAMPALFYNTSQVYDVLAYFFIAAMLYVYTGAREMTVARGTAVVLLYAAALDSKEIAVVAAIWVLAYELLFRRPPRWLVPAILIAMAAIFSIGKMSGANALSKQSGYLLEPTFHRFFVNNRLYASDLLFFARFHTSRQLFLAWCVLTIVCAILHRRELWWCWVVVSTATLPVSFTIDARTGPALYLPLFGWAILAGLLATTFLKQRRLQWTAAGLVAVGWAYVTLPPLRAAAPAYESNHRLTWSAIEQIRALPHPPPHSRIVYLQNPFEDYDVVFISMLVWNDHTLDIQLANKLPQPMDLESFDWVLTFEDEQLRVVRRR